MPVRDSSIEDSCIGDLVLGVASRKRDLSCGTPLTELFKESGTPDTS